MALKNQRCCRVPQYQVLLVPACPLGVYLQGVGVPLPPPGTFHTSTLYTITVLAVVCYLPFLQPEQEERPKGGPPKQFCIVVHPHHLRTGQADLQWAVILKVSTSLGRIAIPLSTYHLSSPNLQNQCKPLVLILSQTTNPSRIIYRRRRRRPRQAITKLGIAIEHHRHHIDINIRTTTTLPPPPPAPPPPPTTTTVTP
ncbi:uncharacterized protein B0T23DRAFT_441910 [Neurospora hispaniola]|uniref:Uncharacterized protein n=1 Tax=Neurospora hispaniola TaxID=588809 RepID=A0AAJ0MR63_9PEZI|nr:hypothetical protein B0T23DRAFT_441910 [Neurospora hispaniola]